MRPRLAVCDTVLDTVGGIAALFPPHHDPAVDFRIDPLRIADLAENVSRLRTHLGEASSADPEIRYVFPFSPYELSDSDDGQAHRTLLLMQVAIGHIAAGGGRYLTVHLPLEDGVERDRFGRAADLLGELVCHGAERGVRVCLENLQWGITSRPEPFLELVEGSSAGVTFDVGHAVSSRVADNGFSAAQFATELGDRVENAHVYGRCGAANLAPRSIEEIRPVLDALLATRCSWWTIELPDRAEVVATRDMLLEYFDSVHLGLRAYPQAIT
jgi:sugar phosphate isomerase/epimerase